MCGPLVIKWQHTQWTKRVVLPLFVGVWVALEAAIQIVCETLEGAKCHMNFFAFKTLILILIEWQAYFF